MFLLIENSKSKKLIKLEEIDNNI